MSHFARILVSTLLVLTIVSVASQEPPQGDCPIQDGSEEDGQVCEEQERQRRQDAQKQAQVDWLRSKGGYFSDKIGFAPPGQNHSDFGGLFAIQDIDYNEQLMYIPKECLYGPPSLEERNYKYKEEVECETAERLADEYLAGKSTHWPYVQYVFESFPHQELPDNWSNEGKNFVRGIVGHDLLDPEAFGRVDRCYDDDDNPYLEKMQANPQYQSTLDAATRIVLARGWHEILVPVYDLGNHHNGQYHNMDQARDSRISPNFDIRALRNIRAGEQLCLSYNECNDHTCYGKQFEYITPSLLADYGFVEVYPQRWMFQPSDDEEELLFNLDHANTNNDKDNQDVSKYEVEWISGLPSDHQLEWLKVNVERLRGMGNLLTYEAQFLPPNEASLGMQYYEALLTALEQAYLSGGGEAEALQVLAVAEDIQTTLDHETTTATQ